MDSENQWDRHEYESQKSGVIINFSCQFDWIKKM